MGDTAFVSGVPKPDFKNLKMTHFVFYNNGGGVTEDPTVGTDYYNYLQGRWKDGKKITAELVEKSGDAISILVRGSKYEIQIDSLSEEDRKFFEKLPDGEILGEEPSE